MSTRLTSSESGAGCGAGLACGAGGAEASGAPLFAAQADRAMASSEAARVRRMNVVVPNLNVGQGLADGRQTKSPPFDQRHGGQMNGAVAIRFRRCRLALGPADVAPMVSGG